MADSAHLLAHATGGNRGAGRESLLPATWVPMPSKHVAVALSSNDRSLRRSCHPWIPLLPTYAPVAFSHPGPNQLSIGVATSHSMAAAWQPGTCSRETDLELNGSSHSHRTEPTSIKNRHPQHFCPANYTIAAYKPSKSRWFLEIDCGSPDFDRLCPVTVLVALSQTSMRHWRR
jgi:hypothetical protein